MPLWPRMTMFPCPLPRCQMNYNNKDNLVGAMIVAGYDEQAGGQVFGCPISGTLVPEKWAIDGSGSTYIWALCDADYRDGMSRDEAEKWVTDAISLALARDSSSGGCIRLVTITKDGAAHKYISGDKVPLWLEDEPAPAPGGAAAAAAAAGMVLG